MATNTADVASSAAHLSDDSSSTAKPGDPQLKGQHKEVADSSLDSSDEKPNANRDDGKIELQEEDVYDQLGFQFPTWRKWTILSVIFIVQVYLCTACPLPRERSELTFSP